MILLRSTNMSTELISEQMEPRIFIALSLPVLVSFRTEHSGPSTITEPIRTNYRKSLNERGVPKKASRRESGAGRRRQSRGKL